MNTPSEIKGNRLADANISSAPQAAANSPPTTNFAQARTFLAKVLPWPERDQQAFINIHVSFTGIDKHTGQEKTFWTGRACTTLDEAINYIEWLLKQPNTVGIYCCMSSQNQCNPTISPKGYMVNKAVRSQESAVALKSLFIDLDFKAYDTKDDAIKALGKFIVEANLPKPSAIVKSGGGLQVHWLLDHPLAPAEWHPFASALVEAMKQSGLKADYQCSIDAARILRVPDTFNNKYGTPRAVEVHGDPQYLTYSVERIKQSLEKYMGVVSAAKSSRAHLTLVWADGTPMQPNPRPYPTTEDTLGKGVDEPPPKEVIKAWLDYIKAHAEALAKIGDYHTWLKFAFALGRLTDQDPENAEYYSALWLDLCAAAPNYDAGAAEEKWNEALGSAASPRDGESTWKSIRKFAADHGCVDQPGADAADGSGVTPTGNVSAPGAQPPVLGLGVPRSITEGLAVTLANVPHRQFLYGVDLSRGEITVSAAPGGSGKSSHAIGMCACLVANKAVLNERIWAHEPKVLYVNGEDSATENSRRIWAFCLKHGLSEQDIKNLSLIGADDWRTQKLSFLRTQGNASVLDQNGFDFLEELLGAIRPDLLVLDPLVSFCGGGNVNDNAVMAQVMRALKRLANKFNCAILILHHTRKGGDLSSAEAISGASSIVNLARRAIMVVPMSQDEAPKLGVLPSEHRFYFRLVSAKSNLAPPSDVCAWYKLESVALPNAEPPTYPHGDNVQAVVRVSLPRVAAVGPDDLKIKRAIAGLVQQGKVIGGQVYPYSPNTTGAKNDRTILNDAMQSAAAVTAPRQWTPLDLEVAVKRAVDEMKAKGWLVTEQIKGSGRYRNGGALRVDWPKTPWGEERPQGADASSAADCSMGAADE
jgi:hypothetical protein